VVGEASPYVNGSRNLISWRNAQTDHLACSWFAGHGWDAAEVSVFEQAGAAFEGDDAGVVDERAAVAATLAAGGRDLVAPG
jgi:hypothetical protein